MNSKEVILNILQFFGIYRIFAFFNRNKLIVLMYHGVSRQQERRGAEDYDQSHVDEDKFNLQMRYLSSHYNVVSAEDLIRCIIHGEKLPKYSVMITADDGFKNNYTAAFPILRELGLPATIFVATGYVSGDRTLVLDEIIYSIANTPKQDIAIRCNGEVIKFNIGTERNKIDTCKRIKDLIFFMDKDDQEEVAGFIVDETGIDLSEKIGEYEDYSFLSWNELEEMQKNNVYIGAHADNHVNLTGLPESRTREEIALSSEKILTNLGNRPLLFSYPYGGHNAYNETTKNLLKDFGYVCAFTTERGFNDLTRKCDFFELKRIGVENNINLIEFKSIITGATEFLSTIKQFFNNITKLEKGD